MYFLENLIRRAARLIGWEIEGAIEGVMWSIGIGCFLVCCAVFAIGAVGWQILYHK
jgi:hypothetical protein